MPQTLGGRNGDGENCATRCHRIDLAGNQPSSMEVTLGNLALPVGFVASSAHWGVSQPSPEFFDRVAETAGVDCDQIAYVGDRLDNDVLRARDAGIFSIFIRRGPWGVIKATWPDAYQAHATIDSRPLLAGLRHFAKIHWGRGG